MSTPITRLTLFVPGTPASEEAWRERGLELQGGTLRGEGLELEAQWVENDGGFGKAFSFGTVDAPTVATIDAAPGALVLLSPVDLREGRTQLVRIVERLRDAGALAVRIEESKVGWDVARWLELMSADDAWAWHRAAIAFLTSDDSIQSCGMHAFSLPDVRARVDGDPRAIHELASVLNVYQLDEDPVIRSGQTFAPDRETPRRVLERWPDTEYPSDHACHNPYGVWRLGSPGGRARPSGELVSVFVPALRAILMAVERENGAALTQEQVEATRDNGACIAMEPRDAQKLERSRGYADLDPELAWEQWQLVRSAD